MDQRRIALVRAGNRQEERDMEFDLAERVSHLEQSDIRRFSILCSRVNGVNLGQGICDQPAPQALKDAVIDAVRNDQASYTHLRGIPELREGIARKLKRFNHIDADPEREICVTVGSAGAFACACLALLDPGDQVVSFSPYYSYHTNMIRLLGNEIRFVDLAPPDWAFSMDQLRECITDHTRFILINTPSNPSGKVFTREELDGIAALCRERNILAVTDEIYEYITFDHPHISPACLPGMAERTVTISGASKTYAVTGHRVGYAAAPAPVIAKMAVLNDLLYICAPHPLQRGVVAALDLPDSYYSEMARDYRAKRDMLADVLTEKGFKPYVPQGAYYMLTEFEPARYRDASHAAESILAEVGVACIPGGDFYADRRNGRYQLRFCFAKQRHDLEEACRRLSRL
jgi:aminotransferase